MADDKRTLNIEDWKPGEQIDHAKLNQPIQALKLLNKGVAPPRQITPDSNSKSSVEIQQFQIESIQGDVLICNPYDGIQAEESQVIIARPWMLRTAMDERGVFTYEYTDDQSRTSTNTDDSTTESQVIVPSYAVGDVINAARNIAGSTGLFFGDDDSPVEWLDMNESARAWAKDS